MNDKINIRKHPALRSALFGMLVICLFLLSCTKHNTDPVPLPVWEDNSSDSAILRVHVQTSQGLIQYNQYVNLALSRDSLNNNLLVRRTVTSTSGTAVFSKLYPRIIYYSCFAITNGQTFFGSGVARLMPGITKDTLLTVH
ncbi:MAG: hypothetical protein NTW31_05375 [Bacteroidetes bacterium]|nr:hypothetical protein [Bacteroidota bacterium]